MTDNFLEIGRPGWLVGNGAGQYRLAQRIGRPGMEGEVWRATRTLDGVPRDYALKILRRERALRDNDNDLQTALDRWLDIWRDTVHRGQALAHIRGIVPTYEAFQDAWPRPPETAPRSSATTLYLASEWVDGEELGDWLARERRSPAAKADLIHQLCHLVDQVAERGLVHRDLSLRNVMVDNTGAVSLIDFSFMRAAGSPETATTGTPGYAAPEGGTDPARDRYSVGAIIYALLTEDDPPPVHAAEWALRDVHEAAGYPVELARHVAALLHPDPQRRPQPLSAWATTFRALLGQPKGPKRYADIALALDGDGLLELAAAGTGYVAVGRNRSGFLRVTEAETGPRDVTALAAARRGNGRIALFATDRRRSMWVRAGRRWEQVPAPVLAGPVRAAPQGDGTAMAFVATGSGQLLGVEVGAQDRPVVHEFGVEGRRVVAAGTSPVGKAVVAVESARGHLLCGAPEEPSPTGLRDVLAAAVTVDQWGAQVCVVYEPWGNRIVRIDRLKGGWEEREDFTPPPGTRDIACVGHRGGITIAVAADTGVCVWSEELDDWTVINKTPASRVVVELGAGGLVRVAAVANQQILYGTENGPGAWWPDSMTEVT